MDVPALERADSLGGPQLVPGIDIEILREHRQLEAVAEEWDDLWRRCPSATPFQSFAWISAWAQAYVPAGRLAAVVVRGGGRMVAAAALHHVRRGPFQVLAPLGGDISDFSDVLLDTSVPGAGRALVLGVLRVPGWDLVDLPEVPTGAVGQGWALGWPGRVARLPGSVSLQLPDVPVAAALARLPARTARTLRAKLRKVDSLGIEDAEVGASDVGPAVDRLLALHRAQWVGRGGNPEHLTARFREHLVAAVGPMIDRGQAVLVEYRVDGELVASEVDLVGDAQLAYYLAGVSPDLRQRIDTAALLISRAVDRTSRLGKSAYLLLRGTEDYKFRWRPVQMQATRFLLARPGSVTAPGYIAVARGHHAVRAAAKRALRGVAADRARALRRRLSSLRPAPGRRRTARRSSAG